VLGNAVKGGAGSQRVEPAPTVVGPLQS